MSLPSVFCWMVVINFQVTLVVPSLQAASNASSANASLRQILQPRVAGCSGSDITWEPERDPDGSFSAVQCKGEEENGRCFCWSPSGARIFGWSWLAAAEKMTCRCSRRKYRLTKDLGRSDVTLHCTQNGNYEQLQCDNELCWCVEPKSGEPTERLYPQSMMKHLPCYTKKYSEIDGEEEEEKEDYKPPERYLRQCESNALGRLAVLKKLEVHGRINTHIDEPSCDDDGSYAQIKIDKKRVLCVWKDSKIIDNYQAEIVNMGPMNCNCARDLKTYAEENLELSTSCSGNGNYETTQMSNGRPFCVDPDGFATTELCKFGENPKCP